MASIDSVLLVAWQALLDYHKEDSDGSHGEQCNTCNSREAICRFADLLGNVFLSNWLYSLYVLIVDGLGLAAHRIDEHEIG